MSILDGLPKDEGEVRSVVAIASRFFDTMVAGSGLTPRQQSVVDLMREGLSLADICKITKSERDAVLALGCRQLQVGDTATAQDTLTGLLRLEPTDERVVYALAATFQAQGKYEVAGKTYIQFLALDATNPQGYMRLGECLQASRELDGARGCFEAAKILAQKHKGDPAVVAQADRMIALLPVGAGAA